MSDGENMIEPTVIIIQGGLPPGDPAALPTDALAIERAIADVKAKGERFAMVGGLPK